MMISFGLNVLLLPLLQEHALAHPNPRSSHRKPTPQGGGIAVVIATLAVVVGALWFFPELNSASVRQHALVFTATLLLALVGAVDDMVSLGAAPRLALQILAVTAALLALPSETRIASQIPWWMERCLLLLAGVWFINLFNFMDGIDWMTVCEVVPLAVGLATIGSLGALNSNDSLLAV